ncbi:MAG TPA: bile acid:sodium symporter family protein, partial [Pilimelia sp.]|nr:bile acid:sodium symporter family protein [Pilimelia sp.]
MSSGLSIVLFPIALGIVMLGLGLSLTAEDFRRVVKYPKAVVISLVCQMLVLP